MAAEKDKKKERQLQKMSVVKQAGSYLDLNATQAKRLRVAQATVDNRSLPEVYALYGLTEKDVRDSKPSWLDDFAAFLAPDRNLDSARGYRVSLG